MSELRVHRAVRAAYFARPPGASVRWTPKISAPVGTKTELKTARSLRQKKYRDEHGLYLAQGPKLVAELLASGLRPELLLATAASQARHAWPGADVLPDHELERIGTLETGNEVVAVLRKPGPSPLTTPAAGELWLALDGISDPGNLGTVLRIADWFGIDHVLCTPDSVDAFNPKCVQASMGAIFRVQVHYTDLAACLRRHQTEGVAVYAADMGGTSVFEERLKRPAVLVLGSESHGLSAEVRAAAQRIIAVPRVGRAESLNVAMAASALCMEFTRQA
jgi:TrmH family RNA methyltransferase